MTIEPPKIDGRKFSEILKRLREMLPDYTPEWKGLDDKEPGVALLKIYSYLAESVVRRLNQASRKNFVAFLDMLGIKLLPAQPARVPLTFTLAKGTEKEVLIPPRTQAAADKTTEHEELPFETEKNLLAIASPLKTAISIDPGEDAIFKPPPGFLEGTVQGLTQTAYQIVSSPVVGAKNFQLDHVTDLKGGDYLRIGEGDRAEYVIIAKISGMIVTTTDKLLKAHSPYTPVAKVISFSLFEGKNLQEHSLYLGHKELFNIKSAARFTFKVIHRPGTESGVTPLKVSWEYWGEVKGEEGEDWRPFQTIDGTNGLSVGGRIELVKTTEGEIKEEEINGVKNRWIRCRVVERLGTDFSRRLPVLDNVTFVVESSGENLQPDLAFNNDIPLDVSQAFTPFGKEPRMFDNFNLGAKEIFSKKGAKIAIDCAIEKRGIIGPPTAIEYGNKIKVFARGTYGRLMEVEIDPSPGGEAEPAWTDHGSPPETAVAEESRPSIVTYLPSSVSEPVMMSTATIRGNISVFVRTGNGHLAERTFNGQQWQWADYGTPGENISVSSDPSAIFGDDTVGYQVMSVFVVGTDGNLYGLRRSAETMTGNWICLGKPADALCEMSPHVVLVKVGSAEGIVLRVFVSGKNGHLYEAGFEPRSGMAEPWRDNVMPDSKNGIKSASSPFAWVSPDGSHVRAYVTGTDHDLWEFDNTTIVKWAKKEHPGSLSIDSGPHGYLSDLDKASGRSHIFVRASDGTLWEWDKKKEGDATKGWKAHQAPANSKLKYSPFVLPRNGNEIFHVFSASSQNFIIEWVSNRNIWNEYKDPNETALTPALSWEYWNSKGWSVIKGLADGTINLLKDGRITFTLPDDIEETEIAGQKSYWLRARIVGGDYGKETFALEFDAATMRSKGIAAQQLISTKNTIRPPIVTSLKIGYSLETYQPPQKCLTYNNLDYIDQTDACRIADKHFQPFVQLDETNRTLYLGFQKPFAGGPVKIFLDARELSFDEEDKPKLTWSYSGKDEWLNLDSLDATEGLVKREILELIGPDDLSAQSRFGDYLYWLKGSMVEGAYKQLPALAGIYPNTTWALQAATIKDEILGSGNGEAHQTVAFLKMPVLKGEVVRVREILTEEEKQSLLRSSAGEDAIFEVKDEKGVVTETWVLWSEKPDLFDSRKDSRHYTLDRATGQLQFGNGTNGMMPPEAKDNIKAFSYQYGGSAQGNVKVGEIKTLKSSVAGVDKVVNYVAADGGADTATLDQMLDIGPAMISHRNRAVTVEDFEWLAKDASRKVVKVRCLPNTRPGANDNLRRENGWVTVIIVPDSPEDRPTPSLELKNLVQRHLETRCSLPLSSAKHLRVAGPSYTKIDVSVDLFVASMDMASEVEREARRRLKAFFHPLTGGQEKTGWDFGRDVSASDVYALLEDIEGLDHLENLKLSTDGDSGGDVILISEDFLVAAGRQTVKIHLAKEM